MRGRGAARPQPSLRGGYAEFVGGGGKDRGAAAERSCLKRHGPCAPYITRFGIPCLVSPRSVAPHPSIQDLLLFLVSIISFTRYEVI